MDSDTSQHHNSKYHSKINKEHHLQSDRKNNYPNGYVEDWISTNNSSVSNHKRPRKHPVKSSSEKSNPDSLVIDTKVKSPKESKNSTESKMVSIILSTQNNLLLNKENSYDIRFSTGILEGTGILINETGNGITFENEGSYRFEICGEASLFSDVNVKLVYFSDKFSPEIAPFSEISIPKEEGKLILRGIPTILPVQKGQKIIPRLIPTPDESMVLLGGTRLLIHKVA